MAINKNVSDRFKISDAHIQQILKGQTKVKFDRPFVIEGHNVLEFDLFEADTARRFELSDPYETGSTATNAITIEQTERRFGFMLQAFYKLLAERKDDELLIVHLGRMHAFDVYFNFFLQDQDKIRRNPALQRRREIVYIHYPMSEETGFYTDPFYQLEKALNGVDSPRRTAKDNDLYLSGGYLSRLHYFNDLKKDAITLASLKDETLSRLGVIVFMDIHYLNSPGAMKAMPTADAIRRSGFKTIKLASESLIAGKDYPLDEMNRLYRTPHARPIRDYELQFLERKNNKMKNQYLNKEIIVDSAMEALHQKLKAYQRGGLQVTMTGLEEEDGFTQSVIKTTTD